MSNTSQKIAEVHCAHDALVPTVELKPNPRNPNKHPEKQIALLAKIIAEQGWRAPITVSNRSGLIVRGHGRLSAAQLLGLAECPVDHQDYADDAAEWADMLADNKIAELAETDFTIMADLLLELDTANFDLSLTGFDAEEIADIMNWTPDGGGAVTEDEFDPEPPAEPTTKPGDIWLLGKHRVMCGDSASAADATRLVNNKKLDCIVSSPPYADLRQYEVGAFDWDALMIGMASAWYPTMTTTAHALINLGICHKDRKVAFYWDAWLKHCDAIGWPLFGWYCWDKGSGMCGDYNGRLAPAHEFVFHFNNAEGVMNKWVETNGTSLKRGSGGKRFRQADGSLKEMTSPELIGQPFKIPDSCIRVTREMARGEHTKGHPAVYPVELPAFILKTWTNERMICADPFLGSGTTLIAAEQLDRVCYGMEISPGYCDVIVRRWETLTGKKAELETACQNHE